MMVIENKDKYDDLVGIETINPTNSSWGLYIPTQNPLGTLGKSYWARTYLTYKDKTTEEIRTVYSPIEYINYK